MFEYPESLVATRPQKPPRVLHKKPHSDPQEISFADVSKVFQAGDLLVINKTQVLPRRIFLQDMDILFLNQIEPDVWEVLFPAKRFAVGESLALPDSQSITLLQKGRPQLVRTSEVLDEAYLEKHGSYALPPYIQQARGVHTPMPEDKLWYQPAWAEAPGSLAAPTASLHFSAEDLENLKTQVHIAPVVLHVGLGTFLPITSENLDEHEMHSEFVEIPRQTLELIEATKEKGGRVWALGTTALRALESHSRGLLKDSTHDGGVKGHTALFLKPGDELKVCDGLLTNFHQPGSTLICLVSALAGHAEVMRTYQWAIENKFRLFSYGDLSIWEK